MAKLNTHISIQIISHISRQLNSQEKNPANILTWKLMQKNRRILTLNSLITFITHFKPILNFCTPEKIKKPLLF